MSYGPDKYPYLTEDDRRLLTLFCDVRLNFVRVPDGLNLWHHRDDYLRSQVERLRRVVDDLVAANAEPDLVPVQAMAMLLLDLESRAKFGQGNPIRFSYGPVDNGRSTF
jgi:hypothetical protein